MAETTTPGHLLKKYDDGDTPGAANLNSNWDTIDTRLMGVGDSFPSTYAVTGLFLRTDEAKLYENTGTIGTPVWTLRIGGEANTIAILGSRVAKVPVGGTLFLKAGQVVTSSLGFRLFGVASILRGLSIVTDIADAVRSYDLELIKDPTGSPTLIDKVSLAATNRFAVTAALSAAVASGDELGFRLLRTAGAAAVSDFNQVLAIAHFEI